jgi:hypothetical protein
MSPRQAAQQNNDDDKKSRLKSHLAVSRQTPLGRKAPVQGAFGQRLPLGKIAEKRARCLAATGGPLDRRFTLG